MKKIIALLCVLLALSIVFCGCADNSAKSQKWTKSEHYVRFMTNYDVGEDKLSSDSDAILGSIVFDEQKVVVGQTAQEPSNVPLRKGYEFVGWFTDKDCTAKYDFSTPLQNKNLTLYAGWQRSSIGGDDPYSDYQEPTVTDVVVVNPDQTELLVVTSVLGQPTNSGVVTLGAGALKKLADERTDLVSECRLSVKSQSATVSAEYRDSQLMVTAIDGETSSTITIRVEQIGSQWTVANSVYENKAVKYEQYTVKPHSVLLAGSSSMENWSTSAKDAAPLTTLNVGIGGTTVDMWINGLANRLIYHHNPRAVVFYVGINNIINAGDDGKQTGDKIVALLCQVYEHLPQAQIYFVLINHVPGYLKYVPEIDIANQIVTEFAQKNAYVTLIDAGKQLNKSDGTPNGAYFKTDGLHMSLCGYLLWGGEIRKTIIDTERSLYK